MTIFTPLISGLLLYTTIVVAQSPKLKYTEKLCYNSRLTPEGALINAWNWFDNHTKLEVDTKEARIRSEQGILKGVSSFQYISKVASGNDYSKGTVYYTVYMRIHDTEGAYTYVVTDFVHHARVSLNALTTDERYPYKVIGDKMWHNMVWKDIKQQVDQHAKEQIESLKTAMRAPSVISRPKKGPVVIVVNN